MLLVRHLARVTQILTVLVTPTLILGCGAGQQSPTGYSCGDVAHGHCYSEALFGDHVTGFRTTFTVVSKLHPGNGFVTNEFWLDNYTGNIGWIELGYELNTVEPLHYFVGI